MVQMTNVWQRAGCPKPDLRGSVALPIQPMPTTAPYWRLTFFNRTKVPMTMAAVHLQSVTADRPQQEIKSPAEEGVAAAAAR